MQAFSSSRPSMLPTKMQRDKTKLMAIEDPGNVNFAFEACPHGTSIFNYVHCGGGVTAD
jgi:hypothetical protein